MAYSSTTDFIALLRQTSGGVRTERMPGLDYVVAAMARMGMFQLSIGQTPPTTNQITTVWFQPSIPSWVAEGTVFLWSAAASQYQVATPALWDALLLASAGIGYSFQSAVAPANIMAPGTSLLAIQRAAPAATTITLPDILSHGVKPIQIVDWSTAVANHVITISPIGGATIMQQPFVQLLSSAVQLAGVTLYPSPELNGWVIAP